MKILVGQRRVARAWGRKRLPATGPMSGMRTRPETAILPKTAIRPGTAMRLETVMRPGRGMRPGMPACPDRHPGPWRRCGICAGARARPSRAEGTKGAKKAAKGGLKRGIKGIRRGACL